MPCALLSAAETTANQLANSGDSTAAAQDDNTVEPNTAKIKMAGNPNMSIEGRFLLRIIFEEITILSDPIKFNQNHIE